MNASHRSRCQHGFSRIENPSIAVHGLPIPLNRELAKYLSSRTLDIHFWDCFFLLLLSFVFKISFGLLVPESAASVSRFCESDIEGLDPQLQ